MEPASEPKASSPLSPRLLYAVLAAYWLHLSTGQTLGWPSPVIPRLNLTSSETSHLSSLFSLGAAPGPIITALALGRLGRRGTLLLVSSLYLLSWLLVLLSGRRLWLMYAARLVSGLGFGASFPAVSVYVTEISPESVRGPLSSLIQTFIALGLLVEYCVGPYVDFTWLGVVSLGVTGLTPLLLLAVPESPHHLLAKGREEEAVRAVSWLRGPLSGGQLRAVIAEIQEGLKREQEDGCSLKQLLRSAAVLKATAIVLLLVSLQQGSGINAVLAYVEFIFQNAQLTLPSELVPILVGATNLFASFPAPYLLGKLGYRLVFMLSTLGSGVSLCALGLYFYLLETGYDTTKITFLPIASVILYNVFFCFGIGGLVWGMAAQLFTPSVKGSALGFCGIYSAIFGFFAIEVFSAVLRVWGFVVVFLAYGAYLVVGGLACLAVVPDVSKMSFQEIQERLRGHKP